MAETEMVERVARAIARNDAPARDWSDLNVASQTIYQKLARTAIEAMREPTDAMMDAIGQTSLQAKIWSVMIDAALEKPNAE